MFWHIKDLLVDELLVIGIGYLKGAEANSIHVVLDLKNEIKHEYFLCSKSDFIDLRSYFISRFGNRVVHMGMFYFRISFATYLIDHGQNLYNLGLQSQTAQDEVEIIAKRHDLKIFLDQLKNIQYYQDDIIGGLNSGGTGNDRNSVV